MQKSISLLLTLLSTIFTPFAALAQNSLDEISCTRGGLQNAIDLYVAVQTSGDISTLPLPPGAGYWENEERVDINTGLINKAMQIDHHMSLIDQDSCQTFTEVIVNDADEPYVLGTRMRINHDFIAEIEMVWTTTDYWLFNAEAYLNYSSSEDWGPIRAAERASRGELVSAANAYLDAFLEGKIDLVPWVRVEGGAYTGRGSPDDSCEVGVPAGVNIGNRRFIVDEVIGSVVVYCTFGVGGPNGGSGSADTHLFRVENGRLRYVHTLTHLLMSDFQGGGDD